MAKFQLMFLFSFFLLGCGSSNKDTQAPTVEIQLSQEKEFLKDSVLFDNLSDVVYLETNQHSVIQDIDRVFIHDDQIVILDARRGNVLFFDMDGKHIRNIQRLGKGPGEYLQLVDMLIDETQNEILLLCGRPYKILHLSLDGEFIKSTPIHRLYAEFAIDPQNIYAYSLGSSNTSTPDDFLQIDVLNSKSNELINSWLERPKFSYFNHRTTGKAVNLGSSLLVSRRFDNSIYEIADGKLETRYSFNFEDHNLPEELPEIDDFSDYTYSNKILYTITDAVETDKVLIFQSNIGTFTFDKDQQVLTRYAYGMRNSEFDFSLGDYQVLGNKKGYLAFFAHPSRLKMVEEMYNKQPPTENEKVKRFLSFSTKLKADDNPVMFIYKLKE